jgi:SOS response regulatory protein OraA/RecX
MKIETVRSIKSKTELLEIVFTDGSRLECEGEVAVHFQLHPGQELDDAQLAQVRAESEFARGRKLAVAYVALQLKPSGAVRVYLQRKKVGQEAVERVIAYLEERGYLDDREFGRKFLASRMKRKPAGPQRLAAELHQKGLGPSLVEELLEPWSGDEVQRAAARRVLEKKLKNTKIADERVWREKAWRTLAAQGFAKDTIDCVVDDFQGRFAEDE